MNTEEITVEALKESLPYHLDTVEKSTYLDDSFIICFNTSVDTVCKLKLIKLEDGWTLKCVSSSTLPTRSWQEMGEAYARAIEFAEQLKIDLNTELKGL